MDYPQSLVDNPPNNPQYGMEHLADKIQYREVWWALVCHRVGDGLVFKAMMAHLKILQIFMANVFLFNFCAIFLYFACLFKDFFPYLFKSLFLVCSMMWPPS